jgi:hypothetical protein
MRLKIAGDPAAVEEHHGRRFLIRHETRAATGPAAPFTSVSIALATGGGGTAARAAASARSASRALCGVIVSGSRSGSFGMISAMTGSSGVIMVSPRGAGILPQHRFGLPRR